MSPPPPLPTLFPYTTLFRSAADRAFLDGDQDLVVAGKLEHQLDRKSTRLNSSHGYTSYAVFCLKKKKRLDHPAAGAGQPAGGSEDGAAEPRIGVEGPDAPLD